MREREAVFKELLPRGSVPPPPPPVTRFPQMREREAVFKRLLPEALCRRRLPCRASHRCGSAKQFLKCSCPEALCRHCRRLP
ncbi:hypothetical protein NDU88_000571 [Pleurodeles waltl]|uniref:Uncharacterized protein n=1 Tax=Pleurodeles waltl TaxID=8319 RepID=A0AAV7VXS6_PLEWA|nr:hypothetical protein NDU88_000571 [Pleurodeles waltl]